MEQRRGKRAWRRWGPSQLSVNTALLGWGEGEHRPWPSSTHRSPMSLPTSLGVPSAEERPASPIPAPTPAVMVHTYTQVQHLPLPLPVWVSCALHTHLVPLQEPEAQEVLQLPQANGTEVQRPPECLIQAKRPLQEAAEPATAPQAQEVAKLMAGDLRENGTATLPHGLKTR